MNERGFTLIETLLYFGLLAIILAIIAATIASVASDKIKLEMIQEVNQNARMVMQTVTKNVNNAASISSPSDGNQSSTLTLAMPDAGEDPIVIDLDNGMVRISVDGDTPVPLTTNEVSVTELVFSNITPTNGSGSVRVEMTIGSSSTSNRQEYQISETFYTAATIKSQ